MIRFALRSLVARRGRAGMTAIAVLLGVSMIVGTFVFTDTINSAFRQLFSDASRGADVIVSSHQDLSARNSAPASMNVSLIRRIRSLPGVTDAQGQVQDTATIVGRDGKAIQSLGAPTLALSYLPQPFGGGLTFVHGKRPRGSRQVAIDEATAEHQGFHVGDPISIVTGQPVKRFVISGIASLGSTSLGGATFAIFSISTARRLYGKEGEVDTIFVAGSKAVAPSELVREIRPMLPRELVVRTTKAEVDNDVRRLGSRLTILKDGLLAFSFISVFVGAFVIFNTFSITVAQRSREFALLRALGATRRQVLDAVLTEAAAVGLLASAVGLAAGLGAAALIRALFTGIGFSLPSNGLTFEPRTAIVGLLVGLLVTIAAGVVPAVRAMRVAPLEALRESMAPVAPGAASRLLSGLVVTGLGIGGVALIASSSGPTSSRLESSGVGAGLLLLAVVLLTPRAVGRATRVLGWPLERGGNVIGRLARENAARNPSRTAVSASSLMIGLALVLFVTVYATGLRTSSNRIIDQTLKGDFTIESTDGASLIPSASARAAALVPQVEAVSSFKTATAKLGSASSVTATGIDPTTIGQVYKFDWVDGSDAILAGLGLGDAILERDTAQRAHVHAGDLIRITTETGLGGTVTVRGIYRDKALLPGFALPRIEFDRIFHQPRLEAVMVKLLPGADRAAVGSQLRQALSSLPGVTARSQRQLRSEVSGRVNSILILFYALLAMSVLLSLLGLVNTLTLSIHERTRELGLLRAVGMTPRQSRELVRGESVITAAMGAVIGIVLGLVFAWVITRALRSEGVTFSIPWLQVIGMFALGLLAGVVASIAPARRAARLDVLAAIANE